MDELQACLILMRAPGVHGGMLAPLLARHGSVATALRASVAEWQEAGASAAALAVIAKPDARAIENDIAWLNQPRHAFVAWGAGAYPPLLAQIHGAPLGLFVRGNVNVLALAQLAIVGSRNPTASGRETASAFAAHLSRCGLVITSGLAEGIDAASHEGALRSAGVTIAVCATGLDSVYPRTHRALAERIVEDGALVSEFPPGTPAHKFHFPRRNRIISALSLGTLVVEAAVHSGSLITAKYAAEQGREVFAIPGSIHNPMARGCHRLLREGAKLVESADDVLTELGPLASLSRAASSADSAVDAAALGGQNSGRVLDKEYKMLLDALGFDPTGIDQLVERSGLRAEEVASMLLILELEDRVEAVGGGKFVRTR